MRREGKPGPFIPSEVRAQTGPVQATTPAPARRRRRATRAIGARAKRPRSGDDMYARAEMPVPARQRMNPGDNVCARATTGGAWEGCFFTNTSNFSAPTTAFAPGRQRLRPGDDVRMRAGDNVYARATTGATWEGCFFTNTPNFNARATTSASGRQRLRTGDDV